MKPQDLQKQTADEAKKPISTEYKLMRLPGTASENSKPIKIPNTEINPQNKPEPKPSPKLYKEGN